MQVWPLQEGKTLAIGPPTAQLELMCDLSLRPPESTPSNSYGLLLSDKNKKHLAYAEVIYRYTLDGNSQLVPGSASEAVLTLLCARDDASARELKTHVETQVRSQGITFMPTMRPPQTPQETVPVLPPILPPLPSPPPPLQSPPPYSEIPGWTPSKFDKKLVLGDGSTLFRGARSDFASVRPCAEGPPPATTAWIQLGSAALAHSAPLAYFETFGRVLTHYCGNLTLILPVVKRAMEAEDETQLTVTKSAAARESRDQMLALGFRDAGDQWHLDLKVVEDERTLARKYVKRVYDAVCKAEAGAQTKLESLVSGASDRQLREFLTSQHKYIKPGQTTAETRKAVMDLLGAEARKYCAPAGNPEDVGLGVAAFLMAQAGDWADWSPWQRKMYDFAKSTLLGAWDKVKYLADKLRGGAMQLLTAVFGACKRSAATGAGCALAMVYLCTYMQAVSVDLGAAAVTASFTGALGLAVSGAVAVLVAVLQALCYFVPKFSAPAAVAGVAASEHAKPTPKPALSANLAVAASCLTESLGRPGMQTMLWDCDLSSTSVPATITRR